MASHSGNYRTNGPVARPSSGQPARNYSRSMPGQPGHFDGGHAPRQVMMNHGHGPGHGPGMGHMPPRMREPMHYHRPARFWDHGHHYFGYRVHCLPPRYHLTRYWGIDYYFWDGIYYRMFGDFYYVCRPPFGVCFTPAIELAALTALDFAYYASVNSTYNTINENAATITAQNETIAANNAVIAQQNADINLNSQRAAEASAAANEIGLVQGYADAKVEYYYDDGVFFTKGEDGNYVTVVPPAGALVQKLPEDYDTVTIEGKEYYKVDDTVFRPTVVEGTLYFEVLGQFTGELAEKYNLN